MKTNMSEPAAALPRCVENKVKQEVKRKDYKKRLREKFERRKVRVLHVDSCCQTGTEF